MRWVKAVLGVVMLVGGVVTMWDSLTAHPQIVIEVGLSSMFAFGGYFLLVYALKDKKPKKG